MNAKEEDDLAAFLVFIAKYCPKVKELMEEDKRRDGTLTGEDLMKMFTI